MALTEAALKDELSALGNGSDPAAAAAAWADAFTNYFSAAEAGGEPVDPDALRTPTTGPRDVMEQALIAADLSMAGPVAIQAGLLAFWAVIILTPGLFFSGATTPAVLPPGLAALGASLAVTGTSNTAQALDKDTAVGNIAADIHTAQAGGTVTLDGVETIT